ncbi:WD40 repeat-like protein [Fomitiporia mediterranea MF3/22]|uniref:WD40 repeat-like protein n=1 Tax=Fomitiporia mediterranea (strain MF3/22) TaxID=694068 RepID=UPI0004407C25|nr:WD40 repeat-like protein [Fomitiporia mediterranea MF3/22]EJC98391.1 WD40 repeat-like protein [Fomitiporia mediterranea MF3/22]
MDAYHRPQCLPGTRTKIQKDIVEWASSCSDQNVFWLHGIAGSGKSTVSTTIAEHFRTISRLGAHLFFERGKSDPSLVIRTLAYKLALFDSAVAKHVSMAIDQDKEIAQAMAATQFESLLYHPLASVSDAMQGPVVIVLDALDECGSEGTRRMLLESLRKGLPSLPKQFRFLITSRKELDIVRVLSSQPDCIVPIELEHDSEACKGDVLRYIENGMRNVLIKNELRIPADWQLRMDRLGDAAGGLFIWASTAIKLVDRDYPSRRLNDLVSQLQSLSGLDNLYRTILEASGISFDDKVSRARFSQVLGLILLCKIPLSDDTIDGILGYSDDESSRVILARLQAVLVYTPGAPIRVCHTSFRDYLLASGRAYDDWFIDLEVQRKFIASRCFDVMRHMLRFNICSIQSSYLRNNQIPDLQVRIKANVPPQLEYACVFWTQHLHDTQFSHALLYELSDLLNNRLPYWLEVMSLLEKVNIASPALLHAIDWSHDADVLMSLKDSRRMITKYLVAISQSTPHIYVTVLLFASMESRFIARHLKSGQPIVQVKQEGIMQQSPFLKELKAHKNCVRSVAFSPDGALVASGSIDATIRIWDAESGQVISGPFEGLTDCVAFSPDSTRIVSGSGSTVRIWNIEKGQTISEPFEGHTGPVRSVAFSPDGMYVVSGSTDKTIIIWNVDSGQIVSGPFEGHTGSIRSVAFSPDGQQIVSGSGDKTIRIWDVKSGQTIFGPIKGHGGKVTSVAFSRDGTRVVSGSEDGEIRFWVAKSGVTSVALSPDGKRIVSGSYDRTVRIWDVESRQVVSGPFKGHTGTVWSVAFSPDGARVASGSDDCTIRLWDTENLRRVSGRFEGHTDDVNSVAFSPNGRYVASGSDDETIRIWDTENERAVSRPFKGHSERIWSVTFSPDGRCVASGSGDKTIRIRDTETGRIISGPFEGHKDTVWSVSFSPDGRRIVSGSGDSSLRIWDVESGLTISGPFKGHDGLVCSVAFSPNGRHVVSGSSDKTIIIWDVESLEVISGPLKGHMRAVRSVAFSPDGTRVVSGSDDTTILIWDVESGKIVAGPFKGHTNWIRSVAFSPDGTRVVSGSGDKTIRIWDVDSGHVPLAPLEGHTNSVLSVAFSPDGMRVVSGSMDHTIRVWNIEGKRTMFSLAQRSMSGNLSIIFAFNIDPVFDWTLSEDGWICGHGGELLLWIPLERRPTLWQARNTAVFNCQFSSRLDFANAALGERWQECFEPIQ